MIWVSVLGVAQATEVARVLIVEPGAQVERGGERRTLEALDRLDESARLHTDETGILILQLHNDHLVRVESELELPVGKLAMLSGPRAKRSVSEQLQDLLYDDERERLGPMVSRAEGLGGWHGSLTAAAVPGAGSGGASDRPSSDGGGGEPKSEPRPAVGLVRGDKPEGDPVVKQAQGWPQVAALYQPDGVRRACLEEWSRELGIHILTDAITIDPLVRDGSVARLQVRGAYPIPMCLRNGLVGQPASADAEPVTIQLK